MQTGLIFVLIIAALLVVAIGLFVAIIFNQQKLDSPVKGFLIVDSMEEDGTCMVYLQAMVDPGTFDEGEIVKLRVRHVKPESQGKQG